MPIRRWDKSKPPTGPWTLNRDSEQAYGLYHWWPMDGGGSGEADQVTGRIGTWAAQPASRTRSAHGAPMPIISVASAAYVDVTGGIGPSFYNFQDNTPMTLAARVDKFTTTSECALVSNLNVTVNAGWQWDFCSSADGKPRLLWTNNAISSYRAATGSIAINDGRAHDVLMVYTGNSSTSGVTHWADGVTGTTGSASNNAPGALNSNVPRVGARSYGADPAYWRGGLCDVRVYSIAVSAACAMAYCDPATRFELWYPLRSRKWISVAAAVGGTVRRLTLLGAGA